MYNMTVLITLSAGADTGPFNLYQNSDGYATAFATGIARATLVTGYNATVSDATSIVRVTSTGVCGTQVYLSVSGAPTTTTTTTLTSTTTSTTALPTVCLAYEVCANDGTSNHNDYNYTYIDCSGTFIPRSVRNGQCNEHCAKQGSINFGGPYITVSEIGPC